MNHSSSFNIKTCISSPTFVTNTSKHYAYTSTIDTSSSFKSTTKLTAVTSSSSNSSVLTNGLDTSVLLTPVKPPKSYGTYTKQQQEEVIAFIKDGNSLRTAEKIFGIPKSTMHCWLKKLQLADGVETSSSDSIMIDKSREKIVQQQKFRHSPPPDKPRTQIIIEEAELIRFLQTSEGAELIAKAYNISINGFNNFIHTQKNQNKLKGLLLSPGDKKHGEHSVGLLHDVNGCDQKVPVQGGITQVSERKRNFSDSEALLNGQCKHDFMESNKKKRLDNSNTINQLVSLLTNKKESAANASKTLVLTPEQLVAASKLIKDAKPGVVNTYLSTRSLVVSSNKLVVPTDVNQTTDFPMKLSPKSETAELSPTFPKIISPVSIKAERIDMDCIMPPPHVPSPLSSKEPHSHLMSTVSTNTSAALNLNEINRTQSEKELMALVDGCDISADDLCADFGKSLDVNKWVDNEAWYTDQYLQFFQVSPTGNSPSRTCDYAPTLSLSSTDYDMSTTGITFTSTKDKEKILSYLSAGNTFEDAEKLFNVPETTIRNWCSETNTCTSETKSIPVPNKQRSTRYESAFYKPRETERLVVNKSAFSKSVSSFK